MAATVVSLEEFYRICNLQDEHLGRELASIRQQLDQVHQGLDRLQGEFDEFRDNFNTRFDRVDEFRDNFNTRFDHVELESKRTAARHRNSTLKNPVLPITPLPAYDPTRGIITPDPSLFPRHAKDFYALRDPTSDRHRRMLSYLVGFYDIQVSTPEGSGDEDEDEDEVQPEDIDGAVEVRAVEMLEGILGLEEDNFLRFRARAAELRSRYTPSTTKRSQPPAQEEGAEAARRARLDLRPRVPVEDKSYYEEGTSQLGWRVTTRSTVSSQQAIITDRLRVPEPPPGSSGSASTRPFTDPREP